LPNTYNTMLILWSGTTLTGLRISDQTDTLALLVIILLVADVSPTYSSGLPQGNVFNHI